jgi:acetyl esterase
MPIDEGRVLLVSVQAEALKGAELPADIEDRTLSVGPRGQVEVRIVRPKGSPAPLPAVMYFHGGGWVFCDRNTHDRLLRELAQTANVAIVFVDYSRSPEVRYPIANEEAYAATKWVAENGHDIGVDPAALALVGDSAGGNMATVVCMLAKERGGPQIGLQVLFCPAVDAAFDTPSYGQFATGYSLDREFMRWFWDRYVPDPAARSEPTASPLRASLEQLRGLPPAVIITAECDVLRDEGEAYARKLIQAGVEVTATRYLGTVHDFMVQNPLANTSATRGAIAQTSAALRLALKITKGSERMAA